MPVPSISIVLLSAQTQEKTEKIIKQFQNLLKTFSEDSYFIIYEEIKVRQCKNYS